MIDIDNPSADTITKSCGNGTDPYVPGAIPGSPDSVDSAVLCQTNRTSYSVSSAFVLTSRKGVTGQLNADGNPATDDFLYSGSPNVARTIRGGTMLYSMEISNAGNVNVTSLDVIDILPFGSPSPGNLGVGNPIALGSTWNPLFLTAITAPAGGKVYYSTDTSPCRPLIVAVPGCQTMTTLADGLPQTATGQWSTVLPADPRTVRSLPINFGSYVLTGGGTLRFEWPMSAPSDTPISLAGPDGIPATADDTDVAWNSFGYSAVRSDTGVAFASAPTGVGIIVEQAPAGLASYGNYVWNDVNRNGVQDEPVSYGINGARVDLYRDGDGNPLTTLDQVYVGTQLTAVDGSGNPGYYLFPGLAAGAYFARFYPPSAYPNASPYDQGADTLDSDGQPVSGQSYFTVTSQR